MFNLFCLLTIVLSLFQIHTEWPSKLKSKGVYFVKKELMKIPDPDMESLSNFLICGDIHANILGRE